MSYKLKISSQAAGEIRDQCLWYEADEQRGGIELSDRWMAALEKHLETLAEHPERHSTAPENSRWRPHLTIRQMLFRLWKNKAGWRILYVINEPKKTVSVLQIRHERPRWVHDLK